MTIWAEFEGWVKVKKGKNCVTWAIWMMTWTLKVDVSEAIQEAKVNTVEALQSLTC